MPNLKSIRGWGYLLVVGCFSWIVTHILNLFQAGAIAFWGGLLSVITLGSSTVRDLPYAMAALNPYPVTSLMLILMFTVLELIRK